jgi:hypothetical protein
VENALKLIIAALVLLLIGVILPFWMVLEPLESTLVLNFVAALSSTMGIIIGFVGIAQYMRGRK